MFFYLSVFLKEVVFVSMNGVDDFGQDRRQPVSDRQVRKGSWGKKRKKRNTQIHLNKELVHYGDFMMLQLSQTNKARHLCNKHSVTF